MKYIVDYYEANQVPYYEQFDLLVINNDCLVYNFIPNSYISNKLYRGIAYKKYGIDTLMMFLFFISKMPRSEMEIGKNILSIYLKEFGGIEQVQVVEEYNERLRRIDLDRCK